MKKFRIKVTYTVWDVFEVEAETEKEALEMVEEKSFETSLNDYNNEGCEMQVLNP
jgi:hypothetical protein